MITSLQDVDPPVRLSARGDAVILIALVVAVGYLTARFEISEQLHAFTRRWEGYQVDEWPIVVFALALGLVWFSRRRYVLAREELRARQRAETRLAEALAKNRLLAQQHLSMHEAAQKHLARELHDELGQYTNAIKLDAITMLRDPDCGCAASPAARIVEAVDHMHAVVSDMVRRLRPAGLDELGLEAAIEQCVTHWRQRMPNTSILLSLDGDFDHLDELRTLTLYRLVQEGLTNASRHSTAQRIVVTLKRRCDDSSDRDRIVLEIDDDGQGASAGPFRPGFGLSSMRERVEMLDGTFAVSTEPHRGFAIAVSLPALDSP